MNNNYNITGCKKFIDELLNEINKDGLYSFLKNNQYIKSFKLEDFGYLNNNGLACFHIENDENIVIQYNNNHSSNNIAEKIAVNISSSHPELTIEYSFYDSKQSILGGCTVSGGITYGSFLLDSKHAICDNLHNYIISKQFHCMINNQKDNKKNIAKLIDRKLISNYGFKYIEDCILFKFKDKDLYLYLTYDPVEDNVFDLPCIHYNNQSYCLNSSAWKENDDGVLCLMSEIPSFHPEKDYLNIVPFGYQS